MKNPVNVLQASVSREAQLRLAHDAIMVKDVAAVLKNARQTVAKNNGTTEAEADEMIHIGDVNYAPSHPPALPAPAPSSLGGIAKLVVGAGLLATGAGAGIGIPLILSALSKPATTKIVHDVEEWGAKVDMIVHPPGGAK